MEPIEELKELCRINPDAKREIEETLKKYSSTKLTAIHLIPGNFIKQAAEFLKDLRVNVDFMNVILDLEEKEITVVDHDGNKVSSFKE